MSIISFRAMERVICIGMTSETSLGGLVVIDRVLDGIWDAKLVMIGNVFESVWTMSMRIIND